MSKINKDTVEQAALSLVLETRKHFKDLRVNAGYEKKWKQCEDVYSSGTDDFWNGASKIRSPELHNSVERIVPKIIKVFFPPDGDYLGAEPKNPNDEIKVEEAEVESALLKDEFDAINLVNKTIGFSRSLSIYGTVFLKTYWSHLEKERYKRIDGERTKFFDIVFDNPDFYSPLIWNIYVDPKDENLEGALIEDIPVNYSDLWKARKRTIDGEQQGLFENVDKLKESKFTQTTDQNKKISEQKRGLKDHKYSPHEHKIIMSEYWGPVPKWYFTKSQEDMESGELIDNALIVIAAGDDEGKDAVILRIDDNPFDHQEKPYLRGRYIKLDGRLYGIGAIEMGISLEAGLNTLLNQLNDNRSFQMKNKWIRDRAAGILESQLQDINNKVIDTDDMNGLEAIRPPDFTAGAMAQIEDYSIKIQDATGASKLLSGTPTGGSLDRTAAGIATVVSAGLEKFELVVLTMEEELLKPLCRHFWMLSQQFLPEGRDVQLTGKSVLKVKPENIAFNPNIKFIGIKELGEKEFKINAVNILLQNLSPYIPIGVDPKPILKRFLKIIGFGDLEQEVFKAPEDQLEYTPEGEVQLLQLGNKVRIDMNDDHDAFIEAYDILLQQPDLPVNVKQNTEEAKGQRLMAKEALRVSQEQQINVEENRRDL